MGDASTDRVRAELSEKLGASRVRWDEETLREHAHDWWFLTLLHMRDGTHTELPACVVQPADVQQVATVLRYANERRLPIVPFGAGSGVCGGVRPSSDAIVVDMRAMDQITAINDASLLAQVQAGKLGDRFEAELNERGYSMGHWPQSIALSTVGGWVATRAAGQLSTRYGSIEDMLVGLQVVLPDGRILDIKPIPRRSAGPDLRHLFLGSEGTLGIVTEATVRIFPLPESRRTSSYQFPSFAAGLDAIRQIVRAGWKPPVVRLYDGAETERHFGEWVTGGECLLVLLSEGAAALTAAEDGACDAICLAAGATAKGSAPVEHWLAERNNVPGFEPFLDKGFVLDTIEVAAGWDRIEELFDAVLESVGKVKGLVVVSGHSSHSYQQGTNIYFTFVARPDDPSQAEATYRECWERTMEATLRCGGTIAHHHGIGRMRAEWMEAEHGEGLSVLREIKRALDPRGIMNPGVLLPNDETLLRSPSNATR